MSTYFRLNWLRRFRWLSAVGVLFVIALAALAGEEDGARLSVRLRAGLDAAGQAAVIARHGGTAEGAIAPLAIQVLRVPAADLPAVLAAYRADPEVESAEALGSRRADWLPDDPQAGSQWALERIGWLAVYSTQTPAGTATVALLDTGIAAGNGGLDTPVYPAASRGVIAVSATDQDDGLAGFSNRGPAVFLAAPGVALATTEGADGYTAVSGTSASAALVAGAAGLLKAFEPALTNGVLIGRLARGAEPVGAAQEPDAAARYGHGHLSLSGSLAEAQAAEGMEPVEPVGALVAAGAEAGAGASGGDGATAAANTPTRRGGARAASTTNAASPTGPAVAILGSSNLGANQVTLSLQSGATGTGWFTLLRGGDADCRTGDQVQAGQSGTGSPALRHGSLSLSADTAGSYTVRNLTQESDYTVCSTAADAESLQPSPAKAGFTTSAPAALSTAWVTPGHMGPFVGMLSGRANRPALAFAPDGTPWFAYVDGAHADQVRVLRLDLPRPPPSVQVSGFPEQGPGYVRIEPRASAGGTGWFTLLPGHDTDCGSSAAVQAGEDRNGSPAFRHGSLPLAAVYAGNLFVIGTKRTAVWPSASPPARTSTSTSADVPATRYCRRSSATASPADPLHR